MTSRHPEAAFEAVIEAVNLQSGRMRIAPKDVERERTIAPLKGRRAFLILIAAAVTGQLDVGEFAA